MRRTHLLLALFGLAVALALAAWWRASAGVERVGVRPSPIAVSPPEEEPSPRAVEAEAFRREASGAVTVREELEPETLAQPDESRRPGSDASTCVLLGRVVDDAGRALPDVLVRASSWRTWTEGVDVPRLEGPFDVRGFEVRTDGSGAFRIEAPVPTTEVVGVRVEPDRFHDSWETRLGTGSSCDGPPLVAGPRDLGEIRLARVGAIRGRVTDESGAPLAGAELTTGPEPTQTYQRDGRTEADGTYLISHAVVGTYGVCVKLDGYLKQFRSPITVEAGRDTLAVDFVLALAPSIEGLVVDEAGQPIEGARLWGWPESSGSGAGAKSGVDGRFVVQPPQDEPYRFSVERDGYETWDEEGGHETTFEPGARGLRIVLRSMPRTRFLVVDAESGEAIERFGLEILENNGARATRRTHTERRPPRPADHPGGVVEVSTRPGIDQYIVAAEGYLLQCADVEHAGAGDASQTIRMQRSGIIRGRVVHEGQPVERAAVTLFGIIRGGNRGPDGEIQWTVRVDRNERSTTATDLDGRFSLDAPTNGAHRLIVQPRDGASLIVDDVQVGAGEIRDLGELQLLPGASVEGQILLPPGIDPAGLGVLLGDWKDDVRTVADARGHFRFEELAAGAQTVTLDERPGLLASGAQAAFELHAGEVTQVTIDARGHGICSVSLQLDLGGVLRIGALVNLVRASDASEHVTLGECDAEGRVSGFVRAWGESRVTIHLPGHRALEHPDARLDLVAGGEVEELLRFELGTLHLLLPNGTALPEEGALRLVLAPAADAQPEHRIHVPIARGEPHGSGGLATRIAGGLSIQAIPAGRWNVRVELEEYAAPFVQIPVGNGFRLERTPYFTGSATVHIATGETTELRLD